MDIMFTKKKTLETPPSILIFSPGSRVCPVKCPSLIQSGQNQK